MALDNVGVKAHEVGALLAKTLKSQVEFREESKKSLTEKDKHNTTES